VTAERDAMALAQALADAINAVDDASMIILRDDDPDGTAAYKLCHRGMFEGWVRAAGVGYDEEMERWVVTQ
jgi:hypothetical protein